jgi:hypothetical protein
MMKVYAGDRIFRNLIAQKLCGLDFFLHSLKSNLSVENL